MMHELAHSQAVLGEGLMQSLKTWWWEWNFRGVGDSTFAAHSDWLFFWIWAISGFFFLLLMVLMFYFTFKYRRRPGAVPLRSRSHNTALELTWSIVPTIILVWMFFEGFRGYMDKSIPPANAAEVVITASMWNWSITYPNGAVSGESTRTRKMGQERGFYDHKESVGVQDTPVFVMPEGVPMRLRMHSSDVIHAFWIPDFRVKFDVYPNRYTTMWFQSLPIDKERAARMGWILQRSEEGPEGATRMVNVTDESGNPVYYQDHWVFCAEYCGQMHSEMYAIIRIVPRDQYVRIIEEWATPTGSPWEIGRFWARALGCFGCHSVDGSPQIGPTWKGLYGSTKQFTDGTSAVADENYIRQSILEPGAKIVQGYQNVMPSYQGRITTDEMMNALIVYIRSPEAEPPLEEQLLGSPAAGEQN